MFKVVFLVFIFTVSSLLLVCTFCITWQAVAEFREKQQEKRERRKIYEDCLAQRGYTDTNKKQ